MSGGIRARLFHFIQRLARSRGLDLHALRGEYTEEEERFREMGRVLVRQSVDLVLDVGAGAGGYVHRIRAGGYQGRICSFEPLKHSFQALETAAAVDPDWSCLQLALGAEAGTATINVAGNSDSSSLLPMGERHARSAPESTYEDTEIIEVSTLDAVWDEVVLDAKRVFLKLDVQGFELEALRGAERSLPQVQGVQAELSLVPLYRGGPTWMELITYLQERGFHPAELQPAFNDPDTGEMLQIDGVFMR